MVQMLIDEMLMMLGQAIAVKYDEDDAMMVKYGDDDAMFLKCDDGTAAVLMNTKRKKRGEWKKRVQKGENDCVMVGPSSSLRSTPAHHHKNLIVVRFNFMLNK